MMDRRTKKHFKKGFSIEGWRVERGVKKSEWRQTNRSLFQVQTDLLFIAFAAYRHELR